jgi:hypothetical protein
VDDSEKLCKSYQNELQQLKREMERKRRSYADEQRSLERERRALAERESAAERQRLAPKEEATTRRKREEEQKLKVQRRLAQQQEAIGRQKREEEENLRKQRAISVKLERGKKRRIVKRNLLPILGMLAGVGVIAAGGATLQIPVVGAGIGIFGTAAAKLSRGPGGKKDKVWEILAAD